MVNYAVPKLDTIGSTGRYEAKGCILWARTMEELKTMAGDLDDQVSV
jgi:hypothetical protein